MTPIMEQMETNERFRQNVSAFQQAYVGSAKKYIGGEYEKEEAYLIDVEAESSYDGETILSVHTPDGRKKYLAGKYQPAQTALDWLEEQGRLERHSVIVVVGMGNMTQLLTLMEAAGEDIMFIIYEPSLTIFQKVMEEYDIQDIFLKYQTSLLIEGINAQFASAVFSRMIRVDNLVLTKVFVSGNYEALFQEQVRHFVAELKKYISDLRVGLNTMMRYTNVVGNNVLNNIAYLYHGYSAIQYKDILPPEVPAIVVSAGPSLNQNIDELKQAVGKACIIATDTAVRPLLKHGIHPDFAVIVDGMKPADQMDCEGTETIALLTSTIVSRNFMNRHHGKKVFYAGGSPYETELLELLNRKRKKNKRIIPGINTGGSVAHTAFCFGRYMGSKTLILVGQDLAFTGNKSYADHTFHEKMEEMDLTEPGYFEVESIDGGKVLTRTDFKLYLDWFEAQIKTLTEEEEVRVIDATEGGAKIHGAEIMALKDAIREVCQRDFSLKELQDGMEEYFSEAEKARMLAYFQGTRFRLEKVARKAKEGCNHYNKMLKLCQKKEFDQKRYLEIAKKVKKTNDFMNSDQTALFVISNLQSVEYVMRATIYKTEENEKDERIMIARQGIALLERIFYASQDLIRRLPGLIEEYQGDDSVLYARYSEAISKLVI